MANPRDETTILLADDETALTEIYEFFLGEDNHVVTAADGEEVLERIDDSVDAVVLDRQMPAMDGVETLATLRERGYETPVGMISGDDPGIDIVEMALDAYLVKPIERDDLQQLVELLLSYRSVSDQCQRFLRLASKAAALRATGRFSTSDSVLEELHDEMESVRTGMAEDVSDVITPNSGTWPSSLDMQGATKRASRSTSKAEPRNSESHNG